MSIKLIGKKDNIVAFEEAIDKIFNIYEKERCLFEYKLCEGTCSECFFRETAKTYVDTERIYVVINDGAIAVKFLDMIYDHKSYLKNIPCKIFLNNTLLIKRDEQLDSIDNYEDYKERRVKNIFFPIEGREDAKNINDFLNSLNESYESHMHCTKDGSLIYEIKYTY